MAVNEKGLAGLSDLVRHASLSTRNVEVREELAAELPLVHADRAQWRDRSL